MFALHDSPTGYRSTMKTPLSLIYAILITVAILAVVLFARSQTSSMIAPASIHAPPPESGADKPAEESGEESGGKVPKPPQPNGPAAE
jgi:hypothetical protein